MPSSGARQSVGSNVHDRMQVAQALGASCYRSDIDPNEALRMIEADLGRNLTDVELEAFGRLSPSVFRAAFHRGWRAKAAARGANGV